MQIDIANVTHVSEDGGAMSHFAKLDFLRDKLHLQALRWDHYSHSRA
ncbi:MAG: hypothetical protein ACXWAV_01115 [Chthoniobacterales bacterium]